MNPETQFGRGGLNALVDTDDLVDRIGLDNEEIAWRKSFIGFDSEDERRLQDLEPLLQRNRETIADDFYDNLLAHEQTMDVIDRSQKGVDALKMTQQAYLVSLAGGEYDEAYFKNRARIGKLHELLEMPLKHYVGQYGVYYDLLFDEVNDRVQAQVVDAIETWADEQEADQGGFGRFVEAFGFGAEGDEDGLEESFERAVREAIDDGMADVLALLKIINLDLQVATDTYVDSYAQRLEDQIERRKQLAAAVEADVQTPIDELQTTSEAVAEQAVQITELTDNQQGDLETAAEEITDVSAAVEEIAATADEVRKQSEQTEARVERARESAADATDALETIETATEGVATAASTLEQRVEEIDSIVRRIDSLAERTSMLATNAGVEARRGGDGSGAMEVIAKEVSSFARQSRRDLEAIETSLEDIREQTERTLETTEETVEAVDRGTIQVRDTVTQLEGIHDAARGTVAGMDDVAVATNQQATNVERAADTVTEAAEAAEQIADSAGSVAAATEEQTASVGEISAAVDRLVAEEETDQSSAFDRH
ncbi:globin-coupled sensor protein [Halobacteria archaeon AArc-curdl1]|uniref:Globin-coupled sensor protein n=1 Tax=Natronosalvus hydrolyticus TaxID=2979988 RepID=A0AAP2Z784_9EURY|nr:globin-coupled sensor protein [Halobacteria archaeon AArc-curdl1]